MTAVAAAVMTIYEATKSDPPMMLGKHAVPGLSGYPGCYRSIIFREGPAAVTISQGGGLIMFIVIVASVLIAAMLLEARLGIWH